MWIVDQRWCTRGKVFSLGCALTAPVDAEGVAIDAVMGDQRTQVYEQLVEHLITVTRDND